MRTQRVVTRGQRVLAGLAFFGMFAVKNAEQRVVGRDGDAHDASTGTGGSDATAPRTIWMLLFLVS